MITFDRCQPSDSQTTCKSDAEIDAWLKGKYITTLENEKKFIAHKFEDERVDPSSTTKWYSISPFTRIDYVRELTRTSMEFSDSLIDLGSFTTDT